MQEECYCMYPIGYLIEYHFWAIEYGWESSQILTQSLPSWYLLGMKFALVVCVPGRKCHTSQCDNVRTGDAVGSYRWSHGSDVHHHEPEDQQNAKTNTLQVQEFSHSEVYEMVWTSPDHGKCLQQSLHAHQKIILVSILESWFAHKVPKKGQSLSPSVWWWDNNAVRFPLL